ATSILMGCKLTVVLVDNGGYGCIDRLQNARVNMSFNNLFDNGTQIDGVRPAIDFVAHAASLGAVAEKVTTVADLSVALERARGRDRTTIIVIAADPRASTQLGGHWWNVPAA